MTTLQASLESDKDQGVRLRDRDDFSERDWLHVLRCDDAPIKDRVSALHQSLQCDVEQVSEDIVDQLCGESTEDEWRNELILAAEHLQIADDRSRRRLAARLFHFAEELRTSSDTRIKPIVESAIRSYASLIPIEAADSLHAFLEPPNPVDTRLAALQAIVNVFEARPPCDDAAVRRISDRAFELAQKFLDRDWLVPGEKAAIGQNAVYASAALGDERLKPAVEQAVNLELRWVSRQLERKLSNLAESWSVDSEEAGSLANKRLHAALDVLRESLNSH